MPRARNVAESLSNISQFHVSCYTNFATLSLTKVSKRGIVDETCLHSN